MQKLNNVILDYLLEYKINSHEFLLIKINAWVSKYVKEKRQISCRKEFQVIGADTSSLMRWSLIPSSSVWAALTCYQRIQ